MIKNTFKYKQADLSERQTERQRDKTPLSWFIYIYIHLFGAHIVDLDNITIHTDTLFFCPSHFAFDKIMCKVYFVCAASTRTSLN